MRAAVVAAAALLALAACHPAPPPPGPGHAALTGGTFVRVEGDGYDQIYVLRPGATAWRLVGDTPKPPLAAGRYWTLAPNGLLGAFIVDGTSLYVQGVDGGPAHQLATAPAGATICAPDWSADSTHLTYVVRHPAAGGAAVGVTYRVAADGTGRVALPEANLDGACDRLVAMDGGTTAFVTAKGAMVVLSGVTRLDTVPGGGDSIGAVLAVSADAARAVVTTRLNVAQVYLFDTRTGGTVPLPGVRPAGPVVFDGDGHLLAIVDGNPVVRTFDPAGRPIATSPVITTRPAATVSLVTWSR